MFIILLTLTITTSNVWAQSAKGQDKTKQQEARPNCSSLEHSNADIYDNPQVLKIISECLGPQPQSLKDEPNLASH